jgi:hypothetical protein
MHFGVSRLLDRNGPRALCKRVIKASIQYGSSAGANMVPAVAPALERHSRSRMFAQCPLLRENRK